MMQRSLGLIETIGLTAAITAADAAVKSANVELVGYELAKGSGMVVTKVRGDVGAVKAAVAAATAAAARISRVVSTTVIARPAQGINGMVLSKETVGLQAERKQPAVENTPKTETLAPLKDIQAEAVIEHPPKKHEEPEKETPKAEATVKTVPVKTPNINSESKSGKKPK